jgi:AcrR family transcriptional regulator
MSQSPIESVTDAGERSGVRRGLMRGEIFEHATRLFSEQGYAGTSFQAIGDAVGLTRPALYHYFSSKEELLGKLVTDASNIAPDVELVSRQRDLPTAERLYALVRMMVRTQGEQRALCRLLLRLEAQLPEDIAEIRENNRMALMRSFTDVIEEGVASGELRKVNPRFAAFGLLGIVNWVPWWYTSEDEYDLGAASEELAEMAVRSLIADGARVLSHNPAEIVRSLRDDIARLEAALERI